MEGVILGLSLITQVYSQIAPLTPLTPGSGELDGRCYLPQLPGPCRARIPSFSYNAIRQRCELFYYGGCQGNGNRFSTLGECQMACGRGGVVNPCTQPPETGPCRAAFRRWYYNPMLGRCQMFMYGGCRGNANRFDTRQECQRRCATDIIPPPGSPCGEPSGQSGMCMAYIPSWTYNRRTGRCEEFVYGGCGGNRNRFESYRECRGTCLMVGGIVGGGGGGGIGGIGTGGGGGGIGGIGTGGGGGGIGGIGTGGGGGGIGGIGTGGGGGGIGGIGTGGGGGGIGGIGTGGGDGGIGGIGTGGGGGGIGGIGGGGGGGGIGGIGSGGGGGGIGGIGSGGGGGGIGGGGDVCMQPGDSGPCRSFLPRWSYNMREGRCERFIYGGCGGNGNRFNTRRQCEDRCTGSGGGIGNSRCLMRRDRGPCIRNIPRWHYNFMTRRCEPFLYGGCLGNANRFRSLRQCQRTCIFTMG